MSFFMRVCSVSSFKTDCLSSLVFASPVAATEITIGGVKGIVAPANALTMFALIWYSSDVPMTKAELNQIYAYLGAKYSKPYPVLA